MSVIEGKIIFEQLTSSISNATIYIRLENVSLADAPSQVVAQKVLNGISIRADSPSPVPFSMDIPALDARERYSLSVHVDVSGDGQITVGDYITMQSYPIPANQQRVQVLINVRPVN